MLYITEMDNMKEKKNMKEKIERLTEQIDELKRKLAELENEREFIPHKIRMDCVLNIQNKEQALALYAILNRANLVKDNEGGMNWRDYGDRLEEMGLDPVGIIDDYTKRFYESADRSMTK